MCSTYNVDTLKALSLKNFQSLADAEIELSPGLNVIVGPSNLGKSAVLRALKALIRNAPSTGLVRDKAKEFKITATFEDGTAETLTKGAKKSQFEIHGASGEVWSYAKAGAYDVPEEIKNLWKIPSPDGRELAFATQHEPPFLLAEPASAVAKVLGDLTNASALMEAVQKANKRRTEALTDAKARTREAEEAREEILSHKGITARGKALKAARDALSAVKTQIQNIAGLEILLDDKANVNSVFQKAKGTLIDTDKLLSRLSTVESAIIEVKALESLVSQRQKITTAYDSLVKAGTNTTLKRSEIETTIHDLMSDNGRCPLCGQGVL